MATDWSNPHGSTYRRQQMNSAKLKENAKQQKKREKQERKERERLNTVRKKQEVARSKETKEQEALYYAQYAKRAPSKDGVGAKKSKKELKKSGGKKNGEVKKSGGKKNVLERASTKQELYENMEVLRANSQLQKKQILDLTSQLDRVSHELTIAREAVYTSPNNQAQKLFEEVQHLNSQLASKDATILQLRKQLDLARDRNPLCSNEESARAQIRAEVLEEQDSKYRTIVTKMRQLMDDVVQKEAKIQQQQKEIDKAKLVITRLMSDPPRVNKTAITESKSSPSVFFATDTIEHGQKLQKGDLMTRSASSPSRPEDIVTTRPYRSASTGSIHQNVCPHLYQRRQANLYN